MSKRLWLLLASVGVAAFIGGYGATAKAWHTYWHGYFFGTNDFFGLEVLPPFGGPAGCQGNGWAIPAWVDTANEFTNFIICKLGGNTQNRRGAAFIISTMIGQNNPNPTAAQRTEFVNRVNYAASRGWINFSAVNGCILPNTFYQDAGSGDVAKDNTCGSGPGNGINFYNGSSWYIIKRFCGNPVGSMPPLADDVNFNMSGATGLNDDTVIPGQIITFSHSLTNGGPTGTSPTTIGWTTQSASSSAGPWSNVSSGNAGTFTSGQTRPNIGNQNVTVPAAAIPGSQICRRITWNPDTETGGSGASTPRCATVQYSFSLVPSINIQVNGATVTSGSVAEQGDTITFTYAVNNTGTTVSQTVTCTYRQATHSGYSLSPPATVFVPPGANCAPSRTFPAGTNTTIATEASVPAAAVNTTICRSLQISPASQTGGTQTTQACVAVAAKPYLRVYGGDVSAGNGQPTACTSNANAAVIGWNRRGGVPAWAGAGTQLATYALNRIFDFGASLGNTGGPTIAAPPAGLSFANTSINVNNGNFGGFFGALPCITDYYNTTGTTAIGSGNLSSLSGVDRYRTTGPIALFGNINPNQRSVVYVEGDVLITGAGISYTGGSWSLASMPLLQLVVRGDIYISQTVTQLDGVYIAQQNGASGGTIYTCANPALPATAVSTTSGASYTPCRNKLTINGAFVAKQVRFLRTNGTQGSASAGEASSSANIAEVFNFSPALWMAQPPTTGGTGTEYDAITSLPPVL